jgi:hypothetical protein
MSIALALQNRRGRQILAEISDLESRGRGLDTDQLPAPRAALRQSVRVLLVLIFVVASVTLGLLWLR